MENDDVPIQPLFITAVDLLANQTIQNFQYLYGFDDGTTNLLPKPKNRLTRKTMWSIVCMLAFIWPCHKFCHDIATLASVKIERPPTRSIERSVTATNESDDGHEEREEIRFSPIEDTLQGFYLVVKSNNRIVLQGWRPGLDYIVLYELCTWILTLCFGSTSHARWAIHLAISTALAGVRMRWTQSIVAHPSPARGNLAKRSYHPSLILPSLVYAIAQPLVLITLLELILLIWATRAETPGPTRMQVGDILRVLATGCIPPLLAICVLLPLTVVLNRVEAMLLPPGVKTLVHCDRLPEPGATTLYGKFVAPSVRACRSLDRLSLERAVKFYLLVYSAMFMVYHYAIEVARD